jgi:hypothetical protein
MVRQGEERASAHYNEVISKIVWVCNRPRETTRNGMKLFFQQWFG